MRHRTLNQQPRLGHLAIWMSFSSGLFLAWIVITQPVFAHDGHAHADNTTQTKELETFYRRLLLVRRVTADAESTRSGQPDTTRDGTPLVVYAGANRLTLSADHFSRAVAETLDIFEAEANSMRQAACKSGGCSHTPGAQSTQANSAWKRLWAKIKRFGWEVGPDTFEMIRHHGIPYAVYFAVTEALEHTVLAPFFGGIPVCKLLQGAYVFVANPIRDFAQVCRTRLDVSDPFTERSVRAWTAWRLRRQFGKQLKAVLLTPSHSLPLSKDDFIHETQGDLSPIEQAVLETGYWGTLPVRNRRQEQMRSNLGSAQRLPPAQTHSLQEDVSQLAHYRNPREWRFDRGAQIRSGLLTYRNWLGQILASTFFEKKEMTYREYWRAKGILGDLSSALDLYSSILEAAALSDTTGERWNQFEEEILFSGEEFIRFFEDAMELTLKLDPHVRRTTELQLRGLLDLLSRRLKLIQAGQLPLGAEDCSAALIH